MKFFILFKIIINYFNNNLKIYFEIISLFLLLFYIFLFSFHKIIFFSKFMLNFNQKYFLKYFLFK